MFRAVFLIVALLYASPLFAQCLELPIIGNGIDPKGKMEKDWTDTEGSFRPKIPDALLTENPKLAQTYTTIGFPKVVKGLLTASTVITCFSNGLTIPAKLGPMTLEEAAAQAHSTDSTIPYNADLLKVKTPKTSWQRFIDDSIRLASRYFGAAVAWASTSTDNFNRADNADMGAAWDPYVDSCKIASNMATSGTISTDCVEGYNTLVPGASQYSQFVMKISGSWTGDLRGWLMTRFQAPTAYSGYACQAQPSDAGTPNRVRRYDAGSATTLSSEGVTNWADGDVMRCEASGSSISMKRNGVTLVTGTDGTYTSGRGGIGVHDDGTHLSVDDFEVGDLAGGTTVVRHRPIVIQ